MGAKRDLVATINSRGCIVSRDSLNLFSAKVGLTLTMIGALLTVAIFGWSETGSWLVIGSLAAFVGFVSWWLSKPRTNLNGCSWPNASTVQGFLLAH